MATQKADADAPASVTFCDKTHSQRSLFMASGRELKVQRARLEVKGDDSEALDYLAARADFERLAPAE